MQGLRILRAALATTSALTNGLSLSIMEQFFHEQKSQSIHKSISSKSDNQFTDLSVAQ